jgi:hypothetical protein
MAPDAAIQHAPEKKRSPRKKAEKEPEMIEVKIGGRRVKARTQTVQSGAGSLSRFFSSLLS